jgi:hypothetical protein
MRLENHDIVNNQAFIKPKDEGDDALGVRVINWICLIAVGTGFAAGILNIVVGNPAIEFFYCATAILVGGFSWYFSTQHGQSRNLRTPLVVLFLVLLGVVWFTNKGYEGSTPYYIFILCNAAIIISPPIYRWHLFAFVLSSILAFFIVTHNDPTLVRDYISSDVRFLDMLLSFFACIILCAMFVWLVMREYEKEKAFCLSAVTVRKSEMKIINGNLWNTTFLVEAKRNSVMGFALIVVESTTMISGCSGKV